MKLSEMINELTEIMNTRGDMYVYLHDSDAGEDYCKMVINVYDGYEEPEVNIGFDSAIDMR